jgi:anti-sigma factor RsiW
MNHELMKDLLFAFYDGQISPPDRAVVASHLSGCGDCRDALEHWKQTADAFLAPFQAESSPQAVDNVMRKIRILDEGRETLRWRSFVRWALPALALSFTGFTAALVMTVQPTEVSADTLLQANHEQSAPAWVALPPTEDQILRAVVDKP